MVFFIVNPRAGQGMGLRLWEKMKEEGKSLLGEEGFSVFFTEKQGDARLFAREITRGINKENHREITREINKENHREITGENPKEIIIAAGIATAVPYPAIPSINPPNPQANINA